MDFLRQLHGEWMRSVVKDEDAIIQNGQWEVYFRGSLEVEREATKEEIEVNAAFLKLQDVIGKMKK